MFTPEPACPVDHAGGYGEAGWGRSSAWPWSRLNLRSSLSLSLFGESRAVSPSACGLTPSTPNPGIHRT